MPRLTSDDPVSKAIASSFLDFLQHSLELLDDVDCEALEVATDCLRTVFKLDPSGGIHTAPSPRGFQTGGPDLLPEIFKRLLNQGVGSPAQSAEVSEIGLGASAPGLVDPDHGLGISEPGVFGHGSQEPRSNHEQSLDRAAQQGRDVRRRLVPGLVRPTQGLGHPNASLRGSGLGLGGSEQGVQGLGQGLAVSGQGLASANPVPQHQTGDVILQASEHAPLQSNRQTEQTPVAIQSLQQDADKTPGTEEALSTDSRSATQSAVPGATLGGRGTGPSVSGAEPSTPQQKEQRSSMVPGAMESEGGDDGRGKRKEGASGAARSSGVEVSDNTWKKEADELKKQGNEAMAAGRFFEALQLYTQAVSMVDTEAIYYANRAAAHHQLRQYELAIKDCEQSIRLDPRYARAYSRLGLAYFEKGDYQTAIDRGFAKALELDPENAIVKQNLKAAQEKMARQAGREHPPRPQQPPPNPQEASSGVPPSSSTQSQPQVPQSVQGLVDMATNFFTPLASMATGAASSGQNQPGQAAGGSGTGGHAPGASAPGSGETPNQYANANANPGGGYPAQPGQPSANPWGHFQQAFGGAQGARGNHPMFTVNVGGDQAGQQAQQLLTQMFQAFGAAAQQSTGQGATGPNPGVPQNQS